MGHPFDFSVFYSEHLTKDLLNVQPKCTVYTHFALTNPQTEANTKLISIFADMSTNLQHSELTKLPPWS
jgi:hypothetical protein